MSGLLRVVSTHPGPVEADLQRYYQVDLRDRWSGRLTLRRLLTLVLYLPDDSATAAAIRKGPHWSLRDHLIDELRMQVAALGGVKRPEPHPTRPRPARNAVNTPARRRKLRAARARAAARRQAIAEGRIP